MGSAWSCRQRWPGHQCRVVRDQGCAIEDRRVGAVCKVPGHVHLRAERVACAIVPVLSAGEGAMLRLFLEGEGSAGEGGGAVSGTVLGFEF